MFRYLFAVIQGGVFSALPKRQIAFQNQRRVAFPSFRQPETQTGPVPVRFRHVSGRADADRGAATREVKNELPGGNFLPLSHIS